ncbi:MAG: hypothetical protein JO219_05410, partial [Candidatus Eremiobacteraeota bacterium]|nr:hypothetical protein [Candidatus Eremiobacteraeota bacterium]
MSRIVAIASAAIGLLASFGVARADGVTAPTWPKTYTGSQATAKVFQPQIKSWNNYTVLDGIAAVALTPSGAKTPIYGTATFTTFTSADFTTGIVQIVTPKITGTHWPDQTAANSSKYDGLLRSTVQLHNNTIPLASVLASISAQKALPKESNLSHQPPTIFYSQTPAILVVFDGNPIMAPVQGTNLKYAVNTNWNVIQNGADSKYYLLNTDNWIAAANAQGPWTPTTAPAAFSQLPDDANWTEVRQHLSATAAATAPKVFVSTSTADMILTDGDPKLAAISGTRLSYVSNTETALFKYQPSNTWYVLLSGRWFSATDLQGPWSYATDTLPSDFSKIPVNSPRGNVLVSVPHTTEAEYAGAAAAAPQIAKVDPTSAQFNPTYGPGAPEFQPITGTTMEYAVNTPSDVIKLANNVYYACQSGVWFRASSPTGPWTVATSVPSVIYTIPPSSPLYADTFVSLYDNNGNTVTVNNYDVVSSYPSYGLLYGFTAGYLGAYWASGAWWYGTGYYYPGWYYPGAVPAYYPYPATYGGGAYYNTATGAYGRYASAYGPYGGATARAQYNPSTGTYARGGSVYGPNGAAAGGSFYNPRYGVSGHTMQYSDPYGQWGHSSVSTPYGNGYSAHATTAQGSVAGSATKYGNTEVGKSNSTGDVYAAHDGNVY